MSETEAVLFLQENPTFFQHHPTLLLDLRLPDPHQGKAVSLIERQSLLLRERIKALESRLAELISIGRGNDALARNLIDWTCALLRAPAPLTAAHAAAELRRSFAVPLVEIRCWQEPPGPRDAQAARLVGALAGPRCGEAADIAAIEGLGADWRVARSVALIPLRQPEAPTAFGFVVLGSADATRFDASLSTALLVHIGELAGAALAPA